MKKFIVLIVEDENEVRELYRDLLTDNGFEVLLAANGREGLVLAREKAWDLMLLDIMLPEIDGLSVLQEIKDKHDKPVLIISNLNSDEVIARATDLGSNGYVVKSELNPQQFIVEVKKYLNIL
jgi:two-component system response regulator CpxR